jgi:hypothetical protein
MSTSPTGIRLTDGGGCRRLGRQWCRCCGTRRTSPTGRPPRRSAAGWTGRTAWAPRSSPTAVPPTIAHPRSRRANPTRLGSHLATEPAPVNARHHTLPPATLDRFTALEQAIGEVRYPEDGLYARHASLRDGRSIRTHRTECAVRRGRGPGCGPRGPPHPRLGDAPQDPELQEYVLRVGARFEVAGGGVGDAKAGPLRPARITKYGREFIRRRGCRAGARGRVRCCG